MGHGGHRHTGPMGITATFVPAGAVLLACAACGSGAGAMLALQGSANWIPPPSRQALRAIEPIAGYAWFAGPRTLVLKSLRDRSADRNSMFTGDWRRT